MDKIIYLCIVFNIFLDCALLYIILKQLKVIEDFSLKIMSKSLNEYIKTTETLKDDKTQKSLKPIRAGDIIKC